MQLFLDFKTILTYIYGHHIYALPKYNEIYGTEAVVWGSG